MQRILVTGGFAGSGKSTVARHICRDFGIPRLSSDHIGGTIRAELPDCPNAFRSGFAVLYNLADEFLGSGCSVLIDVNMGWRFQWERYDELVARYPAATPVPILLDCSWDECARRVGARMAADPQETKTLEQFLQMPQLPQVWEFLQRLDRPDVHHIDAERPVDQVVADALALLR